MSSALEALRAQREIINQIHVRVIETANRLQAIQAQAKAIAQNPALNELLREEKDLLEATRRTITEVRAFREHEMRRFWPGMWRRWAVAAVFALAAAAAGGAGYGWGSYPHETEVASLRLRVEMLDAIAQRVLVMTPTERQQFDALMRLKPASNR